MHVVAATARGVGPSHSQPSKDKDLKVLFSGIWKERMGWCQTCCAWWTGWKEQKHNQVDIDVVSEEGREPGRWKAPPIQWLCWGVGFIFLDALPLSKVSKVASSCSGP